MKLAYYAETDSLYIDLAERAGVDSREVSPGVVLDFDGAGQLVGIDIDQASKRVNMAGLDMVGVPASMLRRNVS